MPTWRLDTTRTLILGILLAVLALMLATVKDPAGAAITGDPDVALFNPSNGCVTCR